jgi:nucleotide-binding universal stress UspA family protein
MITSFNFNPGARMNRFSTSLLGEAKTLLLATDASHFSDGAAQEAIFFGQACGARVVVLHVVRNEAESLKSANAKLMRRQQEARPYLDQFRKMAQDSGVECEMVVVGATHPEKAIVEQAILRKADVILMGRHGREGRFSLLVGSMTAKVIGLGFPKVLVVPREFLISGNHVLLAVDASPSSLAVEEALSLGRCCSTLTRLTVLCVAERERELPAASKQVEDICAKGRLTWPNIEYDPLVLRGSPAETIVQVAGERNVDMIMLGGPSKRGLPRMFLSNVTKNVCGRAHCATLVVTA